MNEALIAASNNNSKISFYEQQRIKTIRETSCIDHETLKEYLIPKDNMGYVLENFDSSVDNSDIFVLFVNEFDAIMLAGRVSPYDIKDYFN
jgi:hypothetical protein